MATQSELFARSGELKKALVKYIRGPQFAEELKAVQRKQGVSLFRLNDAETVDFLDRFILEHRMPDGQSVVEHFVRDHPDLPADEQAMLLGWSDVVDGLFEIEAHDEGALVCVNLIDDLTYRLRSNLGDRSLNRFPPGSFVYTRVVPIGPEWMISGIMRTYPQAQRAEIYRVALQTAMQSPARVFRNPEKIEQGWEMQRKDLEEFIAFFGSDLLVIPAAEYAERMRAYMHYKVYEARDEDGRTAAERVREQQGRDPEPVRVAEPDWERDIETVGVIYDEREGQNLYPDYGLVVAAFENPELVRSEPYRDAVLGYLESDTISGLPIRRLAERDSERASQVFRILFRRPLFSWRRDGEKFLRRYKGHLEAKPVLPGVTPVNDRLSKLPPDPVKQERWTAPRKKLKLKGRRP